MNASVPAREIARIALKDSLSKLEEISRALACIESGPALGVADPVGQAVEQCVGLTDTLRAQLALLNRLLAVRAERGEAAVADGDALPAPSQSSLDLVDLGTTPKRRELTAEQLAARDSQAHEVTIKAFAGSGKTTTLEEYAKARPKTRMLYVAFGKAVALEAQRRFPPNVECKTSHSLAFAVTGRPYAGKLGNCRARDVMEFLEDQMGMQSWTDGNKYMFAQLAIARVNKFLASGSLDPEIGMKGTDEHYKLMSGQEVDGRQVLKAARLLWAAMKDVSKKSVPLPHDGYLKLFGLGKPQLSQYETILLDESQDTTMCVFGMVGRQQTGKILVGDPWQSIYEFRGATNVLERLRNAQRLHLSESFRFGADIANVANALLEIFAGETLKIKGLGTSSKESTRVKLCRTNAGLFNAAVNWMDQRRGAAPMLHLVGGVDGYNLDAIVDTYLLSIGDKSKIKDGFLRRFASYDQMQSYAESVDDKELLARVKIIQEHSYRVPELVAQVKASQVDEAIAQMQMTTAHKSKGLEWDVVELAADFPSTMLDANTPRHEDYLEARRRDGKGVNDEIEALSKQESNLLYVAVTRAKTRLILNEDLAAFVRWHKAQQYKTDAVARQAFA